MAGPGIERKAPELPAGKDGRENGAARTAPADGAQAAAKEPSGMAKPLIALIVLAALGIAVVYGVRYWRFASTHASTDDAQITSDIVSIAPQVSGTVTRVLVSENQPVHKGDLLLTLDDSAYRAKVSEAQANLDMAIAQARGAQVGVAITSQSGSAQVQQAQGGVAQAESGIAGAQADVARNNAAIATARANAKGAQAGVGTAQAAVDAAIANRQRAQDTIASAQAMLNTAGAGVRAAEASVQAAQAASDRATRDAERYATLVRQGAISAQLADQARATALQSQAGLSAAQQQVAEAEATVAQRQADVNAARQAQSASVAAIAQARAQLAAAREQANAARLGVTQAQAARNAAIQSVNAAEAKREQALGQLTQARTAPRQVAVSRSSSAQASAKIEQARAALESARLQLSYCRITAPVDGRVSKKTVEPGALVQPGTPLMAIVLSNDLWVVANFKETQMGGVRPGERADVDVDAVPGHPFRGHVDSVSAGTGSTFALLPPDNATGNFTKIVQRIPVKVTLDPGQPGLNRLSAGMSVVATVETR